MKEEYKSKRSIKDLGSNLEQAEKKNKAIHSQGDKELNVPQKASFPQGTAALACPPGPAATWCAGPHNKLDH